MTEKRSATQHTARVTIRFASADEAERAAKSIAPDNDGHAECMVQGSDLIITAASDSMLGLVRTLDDILGCLRSTGIQ